jgi:hypothetical protein
LKEWKMNKDAQADKVVRDAGRAPLAHDSDTDAVAGGAHPLPLRQFLESAERFEVWLSEEHEDPMARIGIRVTACPVDDVRIREMGKATSLGGFPADRLAIKVGNQRHTLHRWYGQLASTTSDDNCVTASQPDGRGKPESALLVMRTFKDGAIEAFMKMHRPGGDMNKRFCVAIQWVACLVANVAVQATEVRGLSERKCKSHRFEISVGSAALVDEEFALVGWDPESQLCHELGSVSGTLNAFIGDDDCSTVADTVYEAVSFCYHRVGVNVPRLALVE